MSNTSPLILTVGNNAKNLALLADFLNKQGYRSVCADCLDTLDKVLAGVESVDLALLDITGFGPEIWQRCQTMAAKNIRLLVISARQSPELLREGSSHGASGFVVKPLAMRELANLIHDLLAN